eukprot:gene4317-4892_t
MEPEPLLSPLSLFLFPYFLCYFDSGSGSRWNLKILESICNNVRTLKDPEKEEELEQELTGFKWDVIGLSETRKKGEQLKELQSGHVLYTRGENESVGGVGFLVNKNIKDRVVQVNIGSDHRMVRSKIKMNTRLERMKMMRPKGVKVNMNALKQKENEF